MTEYLVVFDVDSTLIQDEVIELLADVAGRREQVAEVTERAMRGEIDFAQSLIERVATLRGLPESVFEEVIAKVRITKGAQETIAAIQKAGGKVAAVSGGFTQILTPLAASLNLDFSRANLLTVADGILTGEVSGAIIDKQAKADALVEWSKLTGLANTVAVGDGANDLQMMAIANLGVAFNAKPIVRDQADVVIEGDDLRELLKVLQITQQ